MNQTKAYLSAILCLTGFSTVHAQQSVSVLTGQSGSSNVIQVYSAGNLAPIATAAGVPGGAFLILPKPDGSKYYVVSNSGSTGVTVFDRNFSNPRSLGGQVSLAPQTVALSPDGRRLIVIAGSVFLYDTATDAPLSNNIGVTGIPGDVTFSIDSSKAFILGNNGGVASITSVDLTTLQSSVPLQFSGFSPGITTGPNGFIYVSVPNHLYEINPLTFQVTLGGDIVLPSFSPGKPIFTPDGRYAILFNRAPANGPSLILVDLATHAIASTFANFGVTLDRLIPAGNNRFYAYSAATTTLYDGTIAGSSINLNSSALQGSLPTTQVSSIATSPESPSKSLFVIAGSSGQVSLYRIDPAQSLVTNQVALSPQTGQVVAFSGTNPISGAATVTAYNTAQSVAANGNTAPLVARVLDINGQPVVGARVDFSTNPAGGVLNPASAFTNSDGYAQTYFTAPNAAGTVSITATVAGTTPVTYQVAVSGGSSGGGGGSGGVAGLSIASGNGQLVGEFLISQPMVVIARDSNGAPLPNVPVTFSISSGNGTLSTTSAVTDANGSAQTAFIATRNSGGESYVPATINAASSIGSANFVVTTFLVQGPNGQGATAPVLALFAPLPDANQGFQRVIKGGVGQVIPGAIKVQLIATSGTQVGQGIPNVGLYVGANGESGAAFATCANGDGGIPLTDANGIATCDVKIGNILSSVPTGLNVSLGLAITTPLITVVATVGPPSIVTITGGNNQTGNAGQLLPQALRVRVTDSARDLLANVPVSFKVTTGQATLTNASTLTDSAGNASTNVTLGPNPGNVVITVTAGTTTTATTTFTLTASANVGGVTAVSGAGQVANQNQVFQLPLVVAVTDTKGAPLRGAAVAFSVTSGSATLSSTSVNTDANGQAQVTVTAGNNPGSVVVTASVSGNSVSFPLSIRLPGPPVLVSSFTNVASGFGGLTPCGLAFATAPNLVPGLQGQVDANTFDGPLPTTLAGVTITVNGVAAPILTVSNGQVEFQTPCEAVAGSATVVFNVNGGTATVSGVPVATYQPGIFEYTSGGRKYGIVLHDDGTYVTPQNPARRGERLKMFLTGLGPVTRRAVTGSAGVGGQTVDATLVVGVNNAGVRIVSAEYLIGEVGVYVVTFDVPTDTQAGPAQPLALAVNLPDGSQIFANGSIIPIQ